MGFSTALRPPHLRSVRLEFLLSASLFAMVGGYARPTYGQAACTPAGGGTYLCEGTGTDTVSVSAPNAGITVSGDLDIDSRAGSGGDALSIEGLGKLSFQLNQNGSAYLIGGAAADDAGLSIRSTGDYAGTLGGIDIDADGVFRGSIGIYAWATGGGGEVDVRLSGGYAVGDGVGSKGVVAGRIGLTGNLTVTTAKGSKVEASDNGIHAMSTSRTGQTRVTVDGDVVSAAASAVRAIAWSDLNIVTGANSKLTGVTGIQANVTGNGNASIDIAGRIETVGGLYGVALSGSAGTGDLNIATRAGSQIRSGTPIGVYSRGLGDISVDVGGYLLSNLTGNAALHAASTGAGDSDIAITTRTGSWVYGSLLGINTANSSAGAETIIVTGDDVWGQSQSGIRATAQSNAGDIRIETVSPSNRSVRGAKYGIEVNNSGIGSSDILVGNRVTATGNGSSGVFDYSTGNTGISIQNGATANELRLRVASTGVVRAARRGVYASNLGIGNTTITIDGDVQSQGVGLHTVGSQGAAPLSITTGSGSVLHGSTAGIQALANSAKPVSVDIAGQVSGDGDEAIYVRNLSGSTTVLVRQGGMVTSAFGDGVELLGQSTVIVEGQVTAPNGVAVRFGDTDDILEMRPGGAIRGGTTAVSFGAGDDRLNLFTGSEIDGALAFDGGNDTLDFSGFAGNALLTTSGLETLTPGERNFVATAGNATVGIFDISGTGSGAIGQTYTSALLAANSLISQNLSAPMGVPSVEPSAYVAPTGSNAALGAAEEAVLSELDTAAPDGASIWGNLIGGVSRGGSAADPSSVFGGIVAGSHAQLNDALIAGGLIGYVQSNTTSLMGQQTLATQTGILGIYGSARLGIADVEVSLIGGTSAQTSTRQVITAGGPETATGTFGSTFLSPTVGLTVPVLSGDMGDVFLETSATYVGGMTLAYVESGSSMNLAVGQQTISILDLRLGLEARREVVAGGELVTVSAKAGVSAQSNLGSASVPVTALGQTVAVATPGATIYGAYAGAGLEAALADDLQLGIYADGAVRGDGITTGSMRLSLTGSF